jgi:hypothetical protein
LGSADLMDLWGLQVGTSKIECLSDPMFYVIGTLKTQLIEQTALEVLS